MARSGLTFSEALHREWVVIVSGQRIASVYAARKFERALRAGELRTGGQDGRVRALYALTERDGSVLAACAFELVLDDRGLPLQDTALPLRELALAAGDGPTLAVEPVRLARAGDCPAPWYASQLWGLEESDVAAFLRATQSLLRRRLAAEAPAPAPVPARAPTRDSAEDATVTRLSVARARRDRGEERVLTRAQLEALEEKHRLEVRELQREIVALRRKLNDLRWTAA
jgi:hypothetical protein